MSVRRRSEPSPGAIDGGWPHQVALPESKTKGRAYSIIRSFCESLSRCTRGAIFFRQTEHWNAFCFAKRDHAEQCAKHFNGEMITPAMRARRGDCPNSRASQTAIR